MLAIASTDEMFESFRDTSQGSFHLDKGPTQSPPQWSAHDVDHKLRRTFFVVDVVAAFVAATARATACGDKKPCTLLSPGPHPILWSAIHMMDMTAQGRTANNNNKFHLV
jgi:hypothetical protein